MSRAYFGASVVTCPSCWPSSSCFCCGCVCVFLLPGVNIFFHLPRPLANWPSSSCCLLWLCVCCFCCWPNNISLSSLCIFFFNFFRMDPKKSEYNLPNTKFLGWYSSYIALPCCQSYPHRHHCPSHWHYCRPARYLLWVESASEHNGARAIPRETGRIFDPIPRETGCCWYH